VTGVVFWSYVILVIPVTLLSALLAVLLRAIAPNEPLSDSMWALKG